MADLMWPMLSVAGFAASVLVHAAAMRVVKGAGAVATFVAVAGAIGVVLIVYCALEHGAVPATLAVALTYAFGCELYIFLFTLVGNSVSFGIITKLAQHPLQPAAVLDLYRTDAMVERRLEQLERSHLIVSDRSGFRLTARGERIVRVFSVLRAVFRRAAPSAHE